MQQPIAQGLGIGLWGYIYDGCPSYILWPVMTLPRSPPGCVVSSGRRVVHHSAAAQQANKGKKRNWLFRHDCKLMLLGDTFKCFLWTFNSVN